MADKIQDYAVNSARWLSLDDFDGEVWKDIPCYEGWYQVSNYGRVKSVNRMVTDANTRKRTVKYEERIIKQFKNRERYYTIHLSKNSKIKTVTTHKIVATAFLPNPNKYPCINHKDETRDNNFADNLEWCTHKYNTNYGTCIQRVTEGNLKRTDIGVPIYKYNIYGNFICEYPSCKAACRETGFSVWSIRQCLDGIHAAAHGFIWLREKDEKKAMERSYWYFNPKNAKKVVQLTKEGKFVARYKSALNAAKITGISRSAIGRCCKHEGYYKTAGGFKWEYE